MKKIGDPQFFGEMEHFRHSSPLCNGGEGSVQCAYVKQKNLIV